MKLLLDQDMCFTGTFEKQLTIDNRLKAQNSLDSISGFLRKFSVWNKVELLENSFSITVLAQKVTLDGIAMNELFSGFFVEYFDFELRYSPLGGAGCDFAMAFEKVTPMVHFPYIFDDKEEYQ